MTSTTDPARPQPAPTRRRLRLPDRAHPPTRTDHPAWRRMATPLSRRHPQPPRPVEGPTPSPASPSTPPARQRRGSLLPLLAADLWGLVVLAVLMPQDLVGLLAVALGVLCVNRATGLYRTRFTENVLDELPRLLLAAVAGIAAGEMTVVVPGLSGLPQAPVLLLAVLSSMVLGRFVAYALRRRAVRRHPERRTRVLILGDGPEAVELGRRMIERTHDGVEPVGLLGEQAQPTTDGLPVLGGFDDFTAVVARERITCVVFAFPRVEEWQLARTIRREQQRLEVYTVPVGYSLGAPASAAHDQIAGIPLVAVAPAERSGAGWQVKRAADVVLSLAALLVLSPVMLATALAVRWEIGPGVIFRQERIGRGGRPFTLLKFTSLTPADDAESATTWNISHDDRIGPVGRFIRATSLDELPQLVNVLRGDMSLVGPRPERPHFVDQYREVYPGYDDRHRAPAGLTGYAAVEGLRGDTSIKDRAHLDNVYIDTWSLWSDAKILMKTVISVVRRDGR